MKTLLMALAVGFILPPASLLRRNATLLAEHKPSPVSAKLLFVDAATLPARWKPEENTLLAQWAMDANAKSCALSVPSPTGMWNVSWKNGVASKPPESWPAVEAMLFGVCGIFMLNSGGDVRVALERFLSSLKINIKTSSLRLVEREVVYAIGEVGERTPQYWIGKQNHAARGLRWVDTTGVLWELRFKRGSGFPQTTELWREGQMALRMVAGSTES